MKKSLAVQSEMMLEYHGPRFRQTKMKEDSTSQVATSVGIPVGNYLREKRLKLQEESCILWTLNKNAFINLWQ